MIRFFQWYRLARSMGFRYVFFRVFFEFRRKSGLLKRAFPVNPPFKKWISLPQWRTSAPAFFFHSRKDFPFSGQSSQVLKEKAERIFNGEVQFFQGEWKKIAAEDWTTNPSTGYQYDVNQHWTTIPDFHPDYGDIKYVWERSRFSFLQTILRYDAHFGTDSSEWVFAQIESWIRNNPINRGPNYRCSQETSLRVFNWTLALYFYRDAASLKEERFEQILFYIYWQLRHVRDNIHFSRIAVRNNHAITETLALYTAGLLFPFFDEAAEWKSSGKKWFEEEIAYQIYEDGTYLQFSFNYHRVVVQLLTWAISIANHHNEKFKDVVYQRAYQSLMVLTNSQDSISGQLPNYGANDGSLFFQWNDADFRDYRPALDALHFVLTSGNAYGGEFEDRRWFGLRASGKFSPLRIVDGVFTFPHGGIYVCSHKGMMVWITCATYKDRPQQADALHVDVWIDGKNVLSDAGSYRYNTKPELVKYFFGTESHNTIMLDEYDQMLKGPRFIWLDWSKALKAGWTADESRITFEGSVKAFAQVGDVTHTRKVEIDKTSRQITIHDQVTGAAGRRIRQLWHLNPSFKNLVSFKSTTSQRDPLLRESVKFGSPTYGVLEDVCQVEFQTQSNNISTQISFA